MWKQADLLDDVTDAPAQQNRVLLQDILAIDQNLAGGRFYQAITMRSSVVLPEPEVPTSIQVFPSVTSNVTASTAGELVPGNCLVISLNAMVAIAAGLLISENERLNTCIFA